MPCIGDGLKTQTYSCTSAEHVNIYMI